MEPLPEEVVRFIDSHVESIDQLEILRALVERPDGGWTGAALAAEVQAPPQRVAADVAALRGRGLVATETRGQDLVCRYNPASPELDSRVQELLRLYRERPVSMIKLVYARAADPLRAFADAFRLRKGEG